MALLLGVVAVVLTGSLLGLLSPFGGFFEAAVRSTRSNGMTALDPVFYGVAGLAAFVLLLALLQFFDAVLKRFSKADPLSTFPERSIEEFANDAAESQISGRVAREGYELLRSYYGERVCIDLDHDLRDDLKLSDEEILQLHAVLLSRTERREMRDMTASNIATIYDLLDYVERAPTQHLDGIAVRVRSSDTPSAELAAAASGMFFRDQALGPKRRATDYTGPRRRASDSKVKRAYSGPHRRSTDFLQPLPGAKSGERQRERPAEPTASDSKHQETHFIPPRNKAVQ